MIAILSLLVVVTLSILVTRIATIALTHTGLSRQSARFQARSAFSGAGFTTQEAEAVVNHPVRRRIVMLLMLLGNAGFVTAVSTLILTFVREGTETQLATRVVFLAGGLAVLWGLASSPWVDRHLSNLIDRGLRRYTSLDVRDYAGLMHLAGDYRLVELRVEPGDWLAGRTLGEAQLRDEGVVVLGVRRRKGSYLGVPNGDTAIDAGDVLIAYGRTAALEELDERRRTPSAERSHEHAVAEQEAVAREERRHDAEQDSPAPPDEDASAPPTEDTPSETGRSR